VNDQVAVLLLTVGSCVVTAAVGLLTLRALRRRRVVAVLVLAVLVPVLAVAVSVAVNVRAMFISSHDSQVMATALVAAVVTAVVIAVVVARWLVAGSRAVGRGLEVLGADEGAVVRPADDDHGGPLPAELAELETALRETSHRLEASRRRERNLEASRRELVAFLSHDLRSPLAGLRALAEGLQDGVVRDVPEALERMRLAVDRMDGMVDDLFELSRLQAPDAERPTTVIDLREVAEDISRENVEGARAAGVHLEVLATDDLAVRGVADELARALSNLIANAVRHTTSGGSVLVEGGRDEDGRVRLSVSDGCGGIAPEHLDRVFDTGWRDDPQRTPGDGRAGLGLAIARGVAEAHAGTLEVENTGAGCRFELTLPAAR
jgi:signal transduction histidine kinase